MSGRVIEAVREAGGDYRWVIECPDCGEETIGYRWGAEPPEAVDRADYEAEQLAEIRRQHAHDEPPPQPLAAQGAEL